MESDSIEADPDFSYVVTGTPSDMADFSGYGSETCSVDTLDRLSSFFGIDLDGFVNDAVDETADDLADEIEDEIEWEFDYDMDCPTE